MTDLLDIINNQIDRNIYHGASLALFKDNQWNEHYIGTIDGKTPVVSGLVYDLASVSKVVGVGTVVISLVHEGKLDIDAPLKQYYPDFHEEKVTLRQLLTHSSGINPFIPNRDALNAKELKEAINHITVEDKKDFLYTDINFLLLGFMLEGIFGKSLDEIFQETVFEPFDMTKTGFGPFKGAVQTVAGISDGVVHDPKAKVLKNHAGSAGLFSNLADLEKLCQHYLTGDFARDIWQNFSHANKERSLAWNKEGDWLDHTGYTGTYVAINHKEQKAAIFLTNRTYSYDDRPLWIKERQKISNWIQENF
ncbi:serine hydrolase domain-containing protein [Streptococcus infantarius]|uniref:serine hydrolase domain-containing protein n=1 Tax=Streptococcus infantarius TaxID=102684 RepID=UPI0029368547|nr:serine hydrolase domain-containing protein [Streptococcus infantarius]MDV2595596.1 serine hydrolase domain-containing protein [Streptococcus infantarius]